MDLGSRLQPWTDLLQSHTARWRRMRHPETGRECWGVLFIGTVNVADHVRAQDADQLRRVREMVDLVRLLAATSPAQFVQVVTQLPSKWERPHNQYEYMTAIIRKVPLAMMFNLDVTGDCTSDLTPWISNFFSHDRGALPQGPFLDERERLIKLLTESQWKFVQENPVQVKLTITMKSQENLPGLETEDFFVDLARFAADVKMAIRRQSDDRCDFTRSFLPLTLERIKLSLRDLTITPSVVQAAMDLAATGVPVKLIDILIDIQYVYCSEEELRRFLHALTMVESKPYAQFESREGLNQVIDSRGQDRTKHLRMIMNAVSSVSCLHDLDIVWLVLKVEWARNRSVIFFSLLLPAMTRPMPLPSLTMGFSTVTRDEVDAFRTLAEEWRRLNPGKLLTVKSILFAMEEQEPGINNELASIIDDAEVVHILPASKFDRISTDIVRTVLRYPSLKKLNVHDCIIESMDLFDPLVADPDLPVKPLLRSLKLHGFDLCDRSSMTRFLKQLQDPSHPLAKSLQRLSIGGYDGSTGAYGLDDHTSQVLADMLQANHVLADVRVGLIPVLDNFDQPDYGRIREQCASLLATTDRCVPELQFRRTDDVKARNCAFLSVMRSELQSVPSACQRLDASVLSIIFDFSAPHRFRSISVYAVRDLEEEEDD